MNYQGRPITYCSMTLENLWLRESDRVDSIKEIHYPVDSVRTHNLLLHDPWWTFYIKESDWADSDPDLNTIPKIENEDQHYDWQTGQIVFLWSFSIYKKKYQYLNFTYL